MENYDCGLLQPLYGTHGGAPPSPDMFGVTMQKNWSKMRSSHMICNVLNTVPETAWDIVGDVIKDTFQYISVQHLECDGTILVLLFSYGGKKGTATAR